MLIGLVDCSRNISQTCLSGPEDMKVAAEIKKMAPQEKTITLKILPSLEPKLGRVYSNYVQVSISQYEFTLRFADAPSGESLKRLKEGNHVIIPNIVEIIVAPTLIPAIIKVLDTTYKKFIEKFRDTTKEDKGTEGQ